MLMVGCRSDRNLNPSLHTFAQGSNGFLIVMLWLGLCLNFYLVFADACKVFNHKSALVNTFCSSLGSTLLLIKNTTIDPLHLWVIKKRFLVPLPGSVALLVSEAGKETFTLCCCFYFAVGIFSPCGPLCSWFVACEEPPHNC